MIVSGAICETCGQSFKPQHHTQSRFCSRQCAGIGKRIPVAGRLLAMSIPEPNSGCWLWLGNINYLGYGMVRDGRMRSAHRASFEVFRGPIPDGMDILHRCDVRCCINPDHLWLGSHRDNMRDMRTKGRNRAYSGSLHPLAKLTEDIVLKARESGILPIEFAEQNGISKSAAARALAGITWRHI